jgi:hypothetical protein
MLSKNFPDTYQVRVAFTIIYGQGNEAERHAASCPRAYRLLVRIQTHIFVVPEVGLLL